MTSPDRYHSQAPAPPGGPHAASPLMLADLEKLAGQAEQVLKTYGPRVELLYGACEAKGVQVPGVEAFAIEHARPPGADMIQEYLGEALPKSPKLARAVLIAIFRFHELRGQALVARRNLALGIVTTGLREKLRQLLFYMGRFFSDFQDDPVLTHVFPPPKVLVTRPAEAQEAIEKQEVRKLILARAENWSAWIAPRLQAVATVLSLVDDPGTIKLKELLTPEGRTARLVAMSLGRNPEAVTRLRDGLAAFRALEGAIAAARGGGPVEGLPDLAAKVDELAFTCRRDPLLRDLFPAGGPPEPPLVLAPKLPT